MIKKMLVILLMVLFDTLYWAKTKIIPTPDLMKPEALFFTNTLKNREKQTNFFADPNLVSRHGGIMGRGRRPLFTNTL